MKPINFLLLWCICIIALALVYNKYFCRLEEGFDGRHGRRGGGRRGGGRYGGGRWRGGGGGGWGWNGWNGWNGWEYPWTYQRDYPIYYHRYYQDDYPLYY